MRYVGSKKRIAKGIAECVSSLRGNRSVYWEPFAGGLNSFSVIAPMFTTAYASDTHTDLMLMWQAAKDGWIPPTDITEEQYAALRKEPPSALRGFVGFGGSFGGKWFGGYARGAKPSGEPRNYLAESSRAVASRLAALNSSGNAYSFSCRSYLTGKPNASHVIYCDPPYAGTQQYSGEVFDVEKFWCTMSEWSVAGALVLVSEYQAPSEWSCIREFSHRMSLAHVDKRKETVERLFIYGKAS